jgi:hypothetical protein
MIDDRDLTPARPFIDYLPEVVEVVEPGNLFYGHLGRPLAPEPWRSAAVNVAVEFDRRDVGAVPAEWPFVRYFRPEMLREVKDAQR